MLLQRYRTLASSTPYFAGKKRWDKEGGGKLTASLWNNSDLFTLPALGSQSKVSAKSLFQFSHQLWNLQEKNKTKQEYECTYVFRGVEVSMEDTKFS